MSDSEFVESISQIGVSDDAAGTSEESETSTSGVGEEKGGDSEKISADESVAETGGDDSTEEEEGTEFEEGAGRDEKDSFVSRGGIRSFSSFGKPKSSTGCRRRKS